MVFTYVICIPRFTQIHRMIWFQLTYLPLETAVTFIWKLSPAIRSLNQSWQYSELPCFHYKKAFHDSLFYAKNFHAKPSRVQRSCNDYQDTLKVCWMLPVNHAKTTWRIIVLFGDHRILDILSRTFCTIVSWNSGGNTWFQAKCRNENGHRATWRVKRLQEEI